MGAARFAAGSLDAAFLDSTGVFHVLLRDLELVWRALKLGGVLMGHAAKQFK